jgi:hypothetical protein
VARIIVHALAWKKSPAEAIFAAVAMFGNPLIHNDINKWRHGNKQ